MTNMRWNLFHNQTEHPKITDWQVSKLSTFFSNLFFLRLFVLSLILLNCNSHSHQPYFFYLYKFYRLCLFSIHVLIHSLKYFYPLLVRFKWNRLPRFLPIYSISTNYRFWNQCFPSQIVFSYLLIVEVHAKNEDEKERRKYKFKYKY